MKCKEDLWLSKAASVCVPRRGLSLQTEKIPIGAGNPIVTLLELGQSINVIDLYQLKQLVCFVIMADF